MKLEDIVPGYYWARQKKYKHADLEIVEVYVAFSDKDLAVDVMGRNDMYWVDDFEFIRKIEIPEDILNKLDEEDYEDNKRPTPSIQ